MNNAGRDITIATEKEIAIAATVMAIAFIIVFIAVFLIGILGGEIGAIFVQVMTFIVVATVLLVGGFWMFREMFRCLLEDYIEYKEEKIKNGR